MIIESSMPSETLKILAYAGLAFWLASLLDYFAGIYLRRFAKPIKPTKTERLESYIKKVTKGTKIFEIIISLYSIYIIARFLILQKVYVDTVIFLLIVFIPCYFNLLGVVRICKIGLEKGRVGKAETGIVG
jgi:hypothetical protein